MRLISKGLACLADLLVVEDEDKNDPTPSQKLVGMKSS